MRPAGGLPALVGGRFERGPLLEMGGALWVFACNCRAIEPETAEYLVALRREKPRRSVRVRIRALTSVVRLLCAHGLSQRPRAMPRRERRAFMVQLPGDL